MKIVMTMMLSLAFLVTTGCGFTKEVRQASATVVPVATYQLAVSNTSISWLIDILKVYKQNKIDEAVAADPNVDPSTVVVMIEAQTPNGTTENVNVDEILENLNKIIAMNLESAHLLDTLNESVQANQGWNPIAGEIENLARDPEFQALVKSYAELLRRKSGE